jgi:hypothetical protein
VVNSRGRGRSRSYNNKRYAQRFIKDAI